VCAFQALKIEFPILRLYNPSAETQFHTVMNSIGLGNILLQKHSMGVWTPIAYFSQAMNKAEANYHSYEVEMLAIVKSILRFYVYLYRIDFYNIYNIFIIFAMRWSMRLTKPILIRE